MYTIYKTLEIEYNSNKIDLTKTWLESPHGRETPQNKSKAMTQFD